jgi:hypothetical protein
MSYGNCGMKPGLTPPIIPTMLTCGHCGNPVPEVDEILLGEIAFHRACADPYIDEVARALTEKHDSLGVEFADEPSNASQNSD